MLGLCYNLAISFHIFIIGYRGYEIPSEDAQQYIVDKHNALRAEVEPPASKMYKVRWSDDAMKTAGAVADTCLKQGHSDVHLRRPAAYLEKNEHYLGCGENLGSAGKRSKNIKLMWKVLMYSWGNRERDVFTYGKPGQDFFSVGHYMTIVGDNTTEIGCAYNNCSTSTLWVCHYCPIVIVGNHAFAPYAKGPSVSSEHCQVDVSLAKYPCKLCTPPCHGSNASDHLSNCNDWKPFCNSSEHGDGARAQCPVTCEVCKPRTTDTPYRAPGLAAQAEECKYTATSSPTTEPLESEHQHTRALKPRTSSNPPYNYHLISRSTNKYFRAVAAVEQQADKMVSANYKSGATILEIVIAFNQLLLMVISLGYMYIGLM